MIEVIFVLVIVFMTLLVMNVPIAVAIAVASMLAMLLEGYDPNLMVASKMALCETHDHLIQDRPPSPR